MNPEQIVQQQLEAYNSRDIEPFLKLFSSDIEMYNFATGEKTIQGLKALRDFYTALFEASPQLHSTILQRICFGNKVIDYEQITGRNGNPEPLEMVLIFEVEGEKIIRVTVMK